MINDEDGGRGNRDLIYETGPVEVKRARLGFSTRDPIAIYRVISVMICLKGDADAKNVRGSCPVKNC